MTEHGREITIKECIDMEHELIREDSETLWYILENGFKGFRNLTDIELVEEHESLSEAYEETFGFPYDNDDYISDDDDDDTNFLPLETRRLINNNNDNDDDVVGSGGWIVTNIT